MNFDSKWYALYTVKNYEKKVAKFLRKRKVDYYCPMNYVAVERFVSRVMVEQPLFPSYVFVRVENSDHQDVKKIPGVTGLIYFRNKPAEFPDVEIEQMRGFIEEHKAVQLKKTVLNTNGTALRIVNNTLQPGNGKLPGHDKRIHLILPSLGCILLAKKDNVEASSELYEHVNQNDSNMVFSKISTIIDNAL